MGGLAAGMPVTYSTSLGASMAISGIPPFNGFFSKLVIILAAIAGQFYLLAALAIVVSIITLASFLKFQKFSFFNRGRKKEGIKEVPFSMCFSMVIMAVLCVVLSLLIFPGIRQEVLGPAVEALLNLTAHETMIMNQ
jgi:multicomponent Na+:H+ antiporter subunit D